MRFVLIGCSQSKNDIPYCRKRGGKVFPEELYSGQLFRKRLEYVQMRELPWGVLSSKYGVWLPDREMPPYNEFLGDKDPADFAIWHTSVANWVLHLLWEDFENNNGDILKPRQLTIEIHAGKNYCHPLADILRLTGVNVELPCKGLGIGQQLALYTSGSLSPLAEV